MISLATMPFLTIIMNTLKIDRIFYETVKIHCLINRFYPFSYILITIVCFPIAFVELPSYVFGNVNPLTDLENFFHYLLIAFVIE